MRALIERLIKLLELYLQTTEEKEVIEVLEEDITFDNSGWADDSIRKERTTKHSATSINPKFITIHYTANNSTAGTINVFKKNSVSSQYVVGRDGEIIQMVSNLKRAWHAGTSFVRSKWGTPYSGLNSHSIGIELVNYGYNDKHVPSKVSKSGWIKSKHRNGGPERIWQPYTDKQVDATISLVGSLMKKYGIPIEHVHGHDDISPSRKVDPGPAFPMNKLKSRLGERV